MKKFIRALVCFTVLMAVMYLPLLFIWGDAAPYWVYTSLKYKRGHSNTPRMLDEARNTSGPDILILGSSHAYRGFDVRIFSNAGYTAFNLGSSSQTPLQTFVLLQRYLKTIHPKFVIYEVYPGTFRDKGIEGAADLISNDMNDSLTYNMALNVNHLIIYNTLAYGYYHDITRGKNVKTNTDLAAEDTYIPGGYVEKKLTYYKNMPARRKHAIHFNEKQMAAFEKSIALLEKSGIQYALVFAPVPKSTYNAFSNTQDFEVYFNRWGRYYDYNTRVDLNDSLHFFDNNHLNQRGVELFNRELLKNNEIFSRIPKDDRGL
ncbi:hypothetical protein ACLI09_13270 [Flavobacterium sp. RHBU_24]|uniref:hypothetical protein n=1 Tax=Flavobacterium sp. RHBU_24 TaxID=3391185 RepID=UPI0039847B11